MNEPYVTRLAGTCALCHQTYPAGTEVERLRTAVFVHWQACPIPAHAPRYAIKAETLPAPQRFKIPEVAAKVSAGVVGGTRCPECEYPYWLHQEDQGCQVPYSLGWVEEN